jgi:HD-GYP domain-containing protein (c-di-GMP phosphodiesterase class II)
MTSDRVYRPAMSIEDAIEELRLHAGAQFDAAVVEALVATLCAPHAGGGTRTPTALTTRT